MFVVASCVFFFLPTPFHPQLVLCPSPLLILLLPIVDGFRSRSGQKKSVASHYLAVNSSNVSSACSPLRRDTVVLKGWYMTADRAIRGAGRAAAVAVRSTDVRAAARRRSAGCIVSVLFRKGKKGIRPLGGGR